MKIPKLTTAHAIIIAGLLIALAIIFTTGPTVNAPTDSPTESGENFGALQKVTAKDHILGYKDAPITIIEYSDLDCPFCQRFHGTMEQIVSEYPNDVRWVYRHFPLQSLHPMAYNESVIAECVAKYAGSGAFWQALPKLLEISSSQSAEFPIDEVSNALAFTGVSREQFQTCLVSGEFDGIIKDQVNNAIDTGGSGTPWSIIIGPDDDIRSINGAQPYNVVKAIVDEMLE